MHDIWNPWHGCRKKSEGCDNCYMYFLDHQRGADGSVIYRTGKNFNYPLHRDRKGRYIVGSGEMLRVCMTSDFFLEEADRWRNEAWSIIHERPDVKFFLLTKRPERVLDALPSSWGDGWPNVMLNVTCENQRRADERIPILLSLPFRHKGIMCAPYIGPVSIQKYLPYGQIEQVYCDGENYAGARPCDFAWVKSLHDECVEADITFAFFGIGNDFVKDGRHYHLDSETQKLMALKSGIIYRGKEIVFDLHDSLGFPIESGSMHVPTFLPHCSSCSMKIACNGCSRCGRCKDFKNETG